MPASVPRVSALAVLFLHPVFPEPVKNEGAGFSSLRVCYRVGAIIMKLPNKTYIFIPIGNKNYQSTSPGTIIMR